MCFIQILHLTTYKTNSLNKYLHLVEYRQSIGPQPFGNNV